MKVINVRGLRSGVGTSFLVASLAYRFSVSNARVLAVSSCAHAFALDNYFNLPSKIEAGWLSAGLPVSVEALYRYTESLDVLPCGIYDASHADRVDWESAIKALLQWADDRYDYLIVDSGVCGDASASVWSELSQVTLDVMEPEAGCLMRLVQKGALADNEYLVINKVAPLSRAQRDVSSFIHCYRVFSERLLPMSIPNDEYALQSALYKQPIAQTMLFAQSAEQINQMGIWLKQKLLER